MYFYLTPLTVVVLAALAVFILLAVVLDQRCQRRQQADADQLAEAPKGAGGAKHGATAAGVWVRVDVIGHALSYHAKGADPGPANTGSAGAGPAGVHVQRSGEALPPAACSAAGAGSEV